jgi:hypothetical protein
LYTHPQNVGLREKVKAEHLKATMSGFDDQGLGKAAPMDEIEDDVSPGAAEYELHRRVVERMKLEPNLSYQRSFVREYLDPANRSLKQRYDAESDAHMQRLSPAVKPFPNYGNPGDIGGGGRIGHTVGRSGAKPRGYAGG